MPHTIVPPFGTKPGAPRFSDDSSIRHGRMEQDGYQALASEAAARIGALAVRAPAWIIGLAAGVVAIVAALACHAIFMSVARRVVDSRAVFVKSLLTQTRGPTRLALVIIALSFAAAAAPLDPATTGTVHHALLIAFIILAGWIGMIAARSAGEIYALRLRGRADAG